MELNLRRVSFFSKISLLACTYKDVELHFKQCLMLKSNPTPDQNPNSLLTLHERLGWFQNFVFPQTEVCLAHQQLEQYRQLYSEMMIIGDVDIAVKMTYVNYNLPLAKESINE